MTIGTDSRNVKIIIQSILQRNGVDNLQLEADLFGAWMRYMNEREEGNTPAETREKITNEYGSLGFVGISDTMRERTRMAQLLQDTLRLNVDGEKWDAVISYCLKAEKKGETVQKYQAWRERDLYNSPKAHKIAENPRLIIATWPQAFMTNPAEAPKLPNVSELKLEVPNAVPNPGRKPNLFRQ